MRIKALKLWLACALALIPLCLMQLLQAAFGSTDRSLRMAVAVDQMANALFGGSEDETLSARTHRNQWTRAEALINKIFGDPEHCRNSYLSELERAKKYAERIGEKNDGTHG